MNENKEKQEKRITPTLTLEKFREELIKKFYSYEFLKRTLEKIIEEEKESFKEKEKSLIARFYKEKREMIEILNELKEELLTAIKTANKEELKFYNEIVMLFLDEEELEEEKIIEVGLKTTVVNLYLMYCVLLNAITDTLDELITHKNASFVFGVAVEYEEIDIEKLPHWVLFNYGAIIEEIKRLLARSYYSLDTYTGILRKSISSNETEKRAYIQHEETAEYSLTALSNVFLNKDRKEYAITNKKLGDFKVILSVTKESEEKLEKLDNLDKAVLDTINYFYRSGYIIFTDTEICRELYGTEDRKKKIYTKPTKTQLEEINNSIRKLRTTLLKVEGENENKSEFYNSENPFISVQNLGIKNKESNTQYYRFLTTPFYFTYIMQTGGKFIDYNRKLLTEPIKEVKKTSKQLQVRYYLIERINNIKEGYIKPNETPFIDLEEIYTLTNAETNQQRYAIATTTEKILDMLSEEFNFKKKVKKRGNKKKGYIINFL